MRKILGVFVLAAISTVPAGAQSAGMTAMQYYVGSWTCTGGPIGQKPVTANVTYTIDNGVMREWVMVAAQGKMKKPYVLSNATTYDTKNGRFVQAGVDSDAAWWVSYAKPWSGNSEVWMDHANSTGKLGRGEVSRTDHNDFTFNGYPSASAAKPNFRVTCKRS